MGDEDQPATSTEGPPSGGTRRTPSGRGTPRGWLAGALIVLTSVSVVASTFAVWVHRTVFDTDRFMETVSPALDDPVFYHLIGERTSTEVLELLDLDTKVTKSLADLDDLLSQTIRDSVGVGERGRRLLELLDRPKLTVLAPPIVAGLESRVDAGINAFFTSEEFTLRFPDLVEQSHEVVIALARNDMSELPNVYVEGEEVRLNLIPAITEALKQVEEDIRGFFPALDLPDMVTDRVDEGRAQLAAAIGKELPEDFGQLTIMSKDDLGGLQAVAVTLDRAVWALVLVSVALGAASIGVARNRRRSAVHLGLGVVVGITLASVAVGRFERALVDEITSPGGAQAARALFGEVLSDLRTLVLVVVIVAVLVSIAAHLAGRPAWLRGTGDAFGRLTARTSGASVLDRWVAGHHDALRVAGIGVAVLVVVVTTPGFSGALGVVALLIGYLWVVAAARRRVDRAHGYVSSSQVADGMGDEDGSRD